MKASACGKIDSIPSGLIDGNYFISGTSPVVLSDEIYENVYIGGSASVSLSNITVTGSIEVFGGNRCCYAQGR